jgi:hypothetical protein
MTTTCKKKMELDIDVSFLQHETLVLERSFVVSPDDDAKNVSASPLLWTAVNKQ